MGRVGSQSSGILLSTLSHSEMSVSEVSRLSMARKGWKEGCKKGERVEQHV